MDELPPIAKDWLALAKRADAPPAGASERVLKRLVVVVGTAHGTMPKAATQSTALPRTTTATIFSGTATKLLTAGTVIAALSGALVVGHRASAPAAHMSSRNAAVTNAATTSTEVVPPILESQSRPAPRTVIAPTRTTPRRSVTSNPEVVRSRGVPRPQGIGLREEMMLLGQASDALNAGDAARGRELLSTHRKRFPEGELREERSALSALANCVANAPGAAARAGAYLRTFPQGILSARIASVCGLRRIRLAADITGDNPLGSL